MPKRAASSIRPLPLILLLLACGGLLTLLYFQRKNLARAEREQKIGEIARGTQFRPQTTEDKSATLSAEEQFDILELDPQRRLDEHLESLFQKAKSNHSKFQREFARSGGQNPGLTRLNPHATTQVEYDAQYRQYLERDVETYLAHTQDPEPIRDAGVSFIKTSYFNEFPPEAVPGDETLAEMAEALLAQSNDPLLRALALFRISPGSSTRETYQRIEREVQETIAKLADGKYPAIVEVLLRSLLRERGDGGHNQIGSPRRIRMTQAIVRWLKEESPATEYHRCIYRRMRDMVEDPELPLFLVLLSREPDVEEYWVHVLAGEYYLDTAFASRGADVAANVTEAQWKGFYSKSERAMVHLRYAWLLRPEYPVAAQIMIRATLGNDDEGRTNSDWFRKSIDAQIDFYPAYDSYLYSLLPRWGGSEQAMIAFGNECVATDRFDTLIPYVYFTVADMLANYEGHPLGTQFQNFPSLKTGLDRFCRQRAAWFKEVAGLQKPFDYHRFPDYALMLYKENQYLDEARELALSLTDDELPYRYSEGGDLGTFAISKLRVANDEIAPLIDELSERLRRRPPEAYSEKMAAKDQADLARLKELATDPAATRCLKHLETMVEQRQALARGEWVDLLNGPEAFGWEFSAADAVWNESSQMWELSGRPDPLSPVGGQPLLAMPLPLEIEAQVGISPLHERYGSESVKGITWTDLCGGAGPGGTYALPEFGLQPRDDGTARGTFKVWNGAWGATNGWISGGDLNQVLRLKLWDRIFEFQINDHIAIGQHDGTLDPSARLAFGENGYGVAQGDRPIRLGHIRVHRLDLASPPERGASREERLAYWQSRWNADSDDFTALREVARVVVWTDPARALELARQAQAARPQMNHLRGVIGLALLRLGRNDEADPEVTAADNESGGLPEVKVAVIERHLNRAESLPGQHESIRNIAATLEYDGEPMLAKAMQARLAFKQEQWQAAVDWNKAALELADEADRPELEARQKEYEEKLREQSK